MDLKNKKALSEIFVSEDEIPEEYRLTEEIQQKEYLVNGEMKLWSSDTHQVYSPICLKTGNGLERKLIGSYPICGKKEALEALDAAEKAYDSGRGEWPSMSVTDRIKCVEKFIHQILLKKSITVKLLMWEIGKSAADSAKEFDRTIEYIYATIDALKVMDRQASNFSIEQGIAGQARRVPLGVVLCMGPFNYPLNETYTTLIPALIMGNTLLFKTPKHGTLLHYPLLEAFKDCFPKGVVNSIYGRGQDIVPVLIESGRVNVLSLIGSSKVANSIKKLHPKSNRLRAVLGLDAKNAAIVSKHADIKLAVQEIVLGSLSFNGQRCTALKIILIDKLIVDTFLEQLSAAVAELKYGMPWEPGVALTPLPEPHKPAYLKECIDDAIAHGAYVVNERGGETLETFVYPAIVYPVNTKMKLYHEEQFGPVIPVVPYKNIEETIQYMIDSPYGQQVSIFSNNATEIAKVVDVAVNLVGRVNINSQSQRGPDTFPFTGRKDSAEGTLSVHDALRAFSIRSLVATKLNDTNKELINEIISNESSHFLSTKFIF